MKDRTKTRSRQRRNISSWTLKVRARIKGENITENSRLPGTCKLFIAEGKWFWKDKNGLENGPFGTMGKARKDACLALY